VVSPAERLGPYEVVRKLARGGMAELYLARTRGPEGFEKLVVLKKILPKFAANPRFVRLFLDEAKLVGTLDHPHIAAVFDMGKAEGDYFFTMEYVHGEDVRATLRRTSRLGKKFPIDHAVQIATHIASATTRTSETSFTVTCRRRIS
jgi:eukaryotic-like serine/threonine-protein kinase